MGIAIMLKFPLLLIVLSAVVDSSTAATLAKKMCLTPDYCVQVSYDACDHRATISGQMLPQPYSVDFDETRDQYVNCFDLNVDYLSPMVTAVDRVTPGLIPITTTQLNLMKPL